MADRLKDRVALVVGAGSSGPGWGNGKATAVLYAREGAKIMALDVNLEAAEETAGIIRGESHECEVMETDVSDAAAVQRAVAACLDRYGRIDILHNNVGIVEVGPTHEVTEEKWDRVLDVNLKGMFLTCKAVLPSMVARGNGAIINISSLASIRWAGVPFASYFASKSGINMFTQGLAIEYGKQGVRANVILPGLMNTPIIMGAYLDRNADDPLFDRRANRSTFESADEMIAKRDALCPTGKMGDAWDVAMASVFLASDEARYINGALLPVDGGLHVKCLDLA